MVLSFTASKQIHPIPETEEICLSISPTAKGIFSSTETFVENDTNHMVIDTLEYNCFPCYRWLFCCR
jgi:hypothetical protein